ncbi:MAG: PorT family protein [Candidatus Azobacteroides sp.]|nr:PorT family protein [Candidatus Azobacteroides sp.]
MKSILSAFILAILCLPSLKAQEQETGDEDKLKVSWGVKAEENLSHFIISGMPQGKSRMRTGATIGGMVQLDITGQFAIQGELLWHYKTSELSRGNLKGDYHYWGMEIPVYVVYKIDIKNDYMMYIGLGPYSEFGFSAKLKREGETINLYSKDEEKDISAMHDTNSGFGFLIGYEFPFGLQINGSYKISITNVLDDNTNTIKLHPATLSIGIGYRFGN